MSALAALAVLILFLLIGVSQTLWLKSSRLAWLKIPIDGGLRLRGRRIFGQHKTIRGFLVIIPVSTVSFLIFGSCLSPAWQQWQLEPTTWASAGFAIGWGYMLGELPNSFLKRQLDIAEGQEANGPWMKIFFNALDESDSVIGALLFGALILPIDRVFVAVVLPSGIALHWLFNQLFIQRKSGSRLYYLSFFCLAICLGIGFNPRITHRLIRFWTRLGLWFMGVRYEQKGKPLDRAGILICNHSSWLDQLLLLAIASKPLVFVAHSKYFKIPLLAWVLRRQGSIPKPQSLAAARQVKTAIEKAVAKDCLVVIFPEGTRSEQGFPLPIRANLRHLPLDVPWEYGWLSGTAACLPRAARLQDVKRGRMAYRSLQPGRDLRASWVEAWIQDHIIPLPDAHDPKTFGNKAAYLAKHWNAAAIPDGFVLASAIADRLNDPMEPDFPERLEAALELWFQRHHEGATWAVRSSGIGEDGEAHSFAGQLETVLHVKTSHDLKAAVRKVLASRRLVSRYEARTGQTLKGCAVILQKQVDAASSGVAFTSFLQGSEYVFMVEHGAGLGDDLVQGRVIPSRLTLCRRSGEIQSEQGTSLPPAPIQQLFELGMRLEKRENRTIDFEWAIDAKGKLFLLQARPVTQDGGFEKFLSNANMNENYPRPVTPFLYSFAARGYQQYFLQLGIWTGIPKRILKAAEPDLKRILGIHEGRLYYDLSAVRACFRHLPCSVLLTRYWDDFLGIGSVPLEAQKTSTRSFLFPLRFVLRLCLWMSVFPWLARRFQRRVDKALSQDHSSDPLQICRDRLQTISDIRFHGWGEAALCDAAVMIHTGIMKTFLKRALPSDLLPQWHAQLLAGSAASSLHQWDDLINLQKISAEFPQIILLLAEEKWQTAWEHIQQSARYERLRKALQSWLDHWGSRVSGELMLTETNYFDDPTMLLKLLAQPIQDRQRNLPTPSLSLLLRTSYDHRGIRACIAAWLAFLTSKTSHAAIAARETCRLAQSRLYGALRANLLATGRLFKARGLLQEADDPFFLSFDELQDLLHESSYSHDLTKKTIALRRSTYASYQQTKVSERIGRRKGRPWFSRESMTRKNIPNEEWGGSINRRFGFPASCGSVKGRVRILHSTEECDRLLAGEILVTRETDPAWIVAMGRAAALVVERGGMLSHGAIVARELGIPAVIGLMGITDDLHDGMEIEVDGQRGMIAWNNSASYGDGAESVFGSDATGHLH